MLKRAIARCTCGATHLLIRKRNNMQYYKALQPLAQTDGTRGCAIALGYFDGIHVGHRAVIQTAVRWAKENGADPALFTFALPQKSTLKGSTILSLDDKHQAVESLGVAHYIAPAFADIKDQTPEQFVDSLIHLLGARAIVCGENFNFGAKAAGDVALLKTLCAAQNVAVFALPLAEYQGEGVSSTRIRTALAAGDIPAVNAMLGAPYLIDFAVQHGQGLGKTLGVPTINQIYPEGFQQPKQGIYITRVNIDGVWYPSATGIGSRPTVNSDVNHITCETFIPNFAGDLYDTTPVLEFYQYVQPIQRFDSLDALKACIDGAAKRAMDYFAP